MIFLYTLLVLSFAQIAFGQIDTAGRKTVKSFYIEEKPKIDGVLDEEVWLNAPVTSDFTELSPNPGRQASQRTTVKVLYTTEGIYVGAKMYDTAADSILTQLSVRDANRNVNADNFAVYIDGMYTQQSSFTFQVTAAGVQIDENDGDEIWDAVWKSAVKIDADGWVAELEIPYSQLRFPKNEIQTWGINFGRNIRRTRQEFFWSPIDPTQENFVQQQGLLTGIERIKPPIRLSFTPYIAGYINHAYDGQTKETLISPTFSAGADMKYGINESFTLDVALVPDFGDVQSDNLVFNISPFEIYYEERRPFFTEGTELFGKANLFYSRRIGSRPERYALAYDQLDSIDYVVKNPTKPYLINALKVSGRTKKGLGIGVFNAITAPTFAQIENDSGLSTRFETENFSNYNVVVFDQQFWKHSYISLINTSVVRFGDYSDALVTGTEFKIADKNNNYGVTGSAAMSHRFLDTSLHSKSYDNGYRYRLFFEKFSGNFTFGLGQRTISKYYNINDMGFIFRTNFMVSSARARYNIYKPIGLMLRMWSKLEFNYERLYNPSVFTRISLGGEWGSTLKNFLSLGADFKIEPMGYKDFFEPRTDGRYWSKPTWTRIGCWFSSDYRKVFALDGRFSYRRFWGTDAWAASDVFGINLQPLIRFSDNFNMIIEGDLTIRRNNIGFVTKTQDAASQEDWIIFGSRYRQDLETTISANYLFTNKISLSLRVRHYWAMVDYKQFFVLNDDGSMGDTNYNNNHNTNYNAFNIDLIFRWRFAPGSELNIVWKNAVLDYGDNPNYNYFNNFATMFETGQNNQFSIKALYFLDFFKLLKNKNRGQRIL
jgi:hypothetical protein